MYELLFGLAEALDTSGSQSMTESEATYQNEIFRNTIISEEAGSSSRFAFSPDMHAIWLALSVIRDLCNYKGPISFGDAEQRLLMYQKQTKLIKRDVFFGAGERGPSSSSEVLETNRTTDGHSGSTTDNDDSRGDIYIIL
jgi:hypothetical protein